MSRPRTALPLRRALPPLGGILAIGLAAGVLISRPPATIELPAKPATARPARKPKAAPAKGRANRGSKGLSATRPGHAAKRQVSKKK